MKDKILFWFGADFTHFFLSYHLQKKLDVQEVQFKKIGGQFANRRESLYVDKAKLETKLENISKEIRDLCTSILPFSLIPINFPEYINLHQIHGNQNEPGCRYNLGYEVRTYTINFYSYGT
mgnify:CR=1 FL=1